MVDDPFLVKDGPRLWHSAPMLHRPLPRPAASEASVRPTPGLRQRPRPWVRWSVAVSAVALAACGAAPADDDDAAEDQVLLVVDLQAEMALSRLDAGRCGGGFEAAEQVPLPPEGIEPGSTFEWELGGPGCFALWADGGGCQVARETGELALGDTFTWVILSEDLMCVGG